MLPSIERKDWGPAQAAHLLNRAGFGATPEEIRAAAGRDPREVVEELVDFQSVPDPVEYPGWASSAEADLRPDRRAWRRLPEEERRARQEELRRREMEQLIELRAWWLYRMRYSRRPLQEKLTLFWHGHFATSFEKVRSSYCMYRQNETFRRLANGHWAELLEAVARDPAMLIYLDNAQSRAEHPNENFARELMELFTLGEGHYTEDDVKAAARAFTGWTLHPESFRFVHLTRLHDSGGKRFLARRGNWDGADVIRIITEQPAAATHITAKLWSFLAYEDPEPELVRALAGSFRQQDLQWKPVLREMLLSRAFYSPRAIRTQVKSPVQWLVGAARMLDAPLPGPDVCQMILRQLGQELFAPPNVKGWDGGYAWITTTSLMQRYNFAGLLLKGGAGLGLDAARMEQRAAEAPGRRGLAAAARSDGIIDVDRILPESSRASKESARERLEWILYQGPLSDGDIAALRAYVERMPEPGAWTADDVRSLLHVMMSTPHFQLT